MTRRRLTLLLTSIAIISGALSFSPTILQWGRQRSEHSFPLQQQTDNSVEKHPESVFWPVVKSSINGDGHLDNDEGEEDNPVVFDSILKIHASHTEPNFLMPWQKQHQTTSTSSGFCIPNGFIMTNAHSVEYASIVQVQKRGKSQKYRAQVLAIANDCDLALLRVVDATDFWEKDPPQPLEFGVLPELQEEVEVLGYPTGGDAMSVTSGVVSRIEMQEYAQSGMHLLAIQIDAAINSGNSGGPVINLDGKVVGVAFQSLEQAENIGYVVPVTVVQHFLEDIRRNGIYSGFCAVGTRLACLENPSQRKLLHLDPNGDEGIMVSSLDSTCRAGEFLEPKDVILSIDGISVSKDGKVPFRPGERVSMVCYLQTKFLGDSVCMEILRRGDMRTLDVPVSLSRELIPSHYNDQSPPYLVVGGYVFTVLSVPYLEALNAWEDFVSDDVSYLLTLKKNDHVMDTKVDELVVLAQVLAHPSNLGYEHMSDLRLETFNDEPVRSLKHLHQLVNESQEEEFIELRFAPNGRLVVLEPDTLDDVTRQICEEHYIQKRYLFHSS